MLPILRYFRTRYFAPVLILSFTMLNIISRSFSHLLVVLVMIRQHSLHQTFPIEFTSFLRER